jgi:hypothetical protein
MSQKIEHLSKETLLDLMAAHRQDTHGVPQQDRQGLRRQRRRQARDHGALLQCQGQVVASTFFLYPSSFQFLSLDV